MMCKEPLCKHQQDSQGPKQVLLTHGKSLRQSLVGQQSQPTTRYKSRHNCASLIPVLMEKIYNIKHFQLCLSEIRNKPKPELTEVKVRKSELDGTSD